MLHMVCSCSLRGQRQQPPCQAPRLHLQSVLPAPLLPAPLQPTALTIRSWYVCALMPPLWNSPLSFLNTSNFLSLLSCALIFSTSALLAALSDSEMPPVATAATPADAEVDDEEAAAGAAEAGLRHQNKQGGPEKGTCVRRHHDGASAAEARKVSQRKGRLRWVAQSACAYLAAPSAVATATCASDGKSAADGGGGGEATALLAALSAALAAAARSVAALYAAAAAMEAADGPWGDGGAAAKAEEASSVASPTTAAPLDAAPAAADPAAPDPAAVFLLPAPAAEPLPFFLALLGATGSAGKSSSAGGACC